MGDPPQRSRLSDRDWLNSRLQHSSIGAVAAECGVTRQAVQQWIKRHTIVYTPADPARHSNRPSPDELSTLIGEHGSAANVAREVGVNPATVVRWCHEAGIVIAGRGRRRIGDQHVDSWRQQRAQGMTLTAIAAAAGVSAETVRRRLGEHQHRGG